MRRKGCFILVIIIFIIAGFILFTINKYNNSIVYKDSSQTEKVLVIVEKGESPNSVRQKLVDNHIIKDEDILLGYTSYRIYAFMTKFDTKIQAGTYQLTKGSSIKDIADILQKADSEDSKVTIKEGLRIEEIAEEINRVLNSNSNRKSKFNKIDFINLAKNFNGENYEFLKSRPTGDKSLEGYLFPDTYFSSYDATAEDMINLMLENFNLKIYQPNLGSIKNNKYNLHQLVTIASILQREVQTPDDMAMVADIYYRRNTLGMKLEADATTQYALGYSQSEGVWWKKDLTAQDLNIDNKYNTRKYAGLPPGPIAGFGVDAFKAALEPKSNDFLYYLSDSEGVTHYAKTYNEHLSNQQRYL